MIRLYLHPDLIKAEVTQLPPGRARGLKSEKMRVRQTSHTKTQGKQRETGHKERAYQGAALNHPEYDCSDCGAEVRPGREVKHEGKLSVDDKLKHEQKGRHVTYHSEGDTTLVRHHPEIRIKGKKYRLQHGAVTAEMVPGKAGKTSRPYPGRCPGCHEKFNTRKVEGTGTGTSPGRAAAAAKESAETGGKKVFGKSVAMLDGMLTPRPVNKSLRLILTV